MKIRTIRLLGCLAVWTVLFCSSAHAAAIVDIVPGSTNPVVFSPAGSAQLMYVARNNSSRTLNALTVQADFEAAGQPVKLFLSRNECSGAVLAPGMFCSFTISMQGVHQSSAFILTPRICVFNGAVCSVPIAQNRVRVIMTEKLPSSAFPLPYAGTFYPLYGAPGVGQWLPPNQAPLPPFNEVSAVFAAFAHAYPKGNGAILAYEEGQPEQAARLALLVQTARQQNPNLKILISLGWGKNDWTYISNDYINHANQFVPSVVQFIRDNHLDGFDIDDEEIGGDSGTISQENFNGVIANLRNALNYASLQDGKPYYLTITPAGNNQDGGLSGTQVTAQNAFNFNLINIQTYYNGDPEFGEDFFNELITIGYPRQAIANGIDTGVSCNPDYPPYLGLAGLFNWNMTADSACSQYENTREIADLVGYYS